MAASLKYVPILKGKEGEFAALEELRTDVRSAIAPLIEVPSVPYDYVNDQPAKTLEAHIAGIALRLRKCWSGDGLVYLDLPNFGDGELLEDGTVALQLVLNDCLAKGLTIAPVISTTSSDDYLGAAAPHVAGSEAGACIRLRVSDFQEDKDPEKEIGDLLSSLGPK